MHTPLNPSYGAKESKLAFLMCDLCTVSCCVPEKSVPVANIYNWKCHMKTMNVWLSLKAGTLGEMSWQSRVLALLAERVCYLPSMAHKHL